VSLLRHEVDTKKEIIGKLQMEISSLGEEILQKTRLIQSQSIVQTSQRGELDEIVGGE